MGRLVRMVTAVATPVGALYGFAPVQTEAAIALAVRPLFRRARASRPLR